MSESDNWFVDSPTIIMFEPSFTISDVHPMSYWDAKMNRRRWRKWKRLFRKWKRELKRR